MIGDKYVANSFKALLSPSQSILETVTAYQTRCVTTAR